MKRKISSPVLMCSLVITKEGTTSYNYVLIIPSLSTVVFNDTFPIKNMED